MLNPEKFRPRWAVVHLFEAQNLFPLDWGEWLYNESSPTPGSWKITDASQLCARLAEDDRAGLARLLHEWEAYTVKNFKIEHLWESIPFPLELGG